MSAVWWISQVRTFEPSMRGGYLWAPLADRRGHPRWARLRELATGDVTIHYTRGGIAAVGRVISPPFPSRCPPDLTGLSPGLEGLPGRRVDVEYFVLRPTIELKPELLERLQRTHPERGPFDKNGRPKQTYVLPFSAAGLRVLRESSRALWPPWAERLVS